jgi:hypothetical protein
MTDTPRKDELFALTVFLATSARGSIEEGVFTASYRLIDAIRRLLAAFPEFTEEPFFAELAEIAGDRFRAAYLGSEAEYLKALDAIVAHAAREIRLRAGMDAPAALLQKNSSSRT